MGIASGAYEFSLKYSKERKAFGTEIMNHQAIAFKLADMATEIEAARLLCLKAAWLKDQHQNYDRASSMAKLFASEVAMKTAVEAVQIHGGYGYVKEYHVIYGVEGNALAHHLYSNVSQIQAISFMIFTLIYTPCLSTIATLKNESKNLSFVIYSVS